MLKIRLGGMTLMLLLMSFGGANAQTPASVPSYEVSPLANFVGEYRDKRRVILEAIANLPANTPIEERLAIYDREIGKLKTTFLSTRRAEYESRSYAGSVDHSCTSGKSGGKKNCGFKCVTSPSSDLHLTSINVTGTNKGTRKEESQACLKMTVAGKGRNHGVLNATFKFKPVSIERRLQADATKLFEIIGQHDPNKT